jgi:hypothetical protein
MRNVVVVLAALLTLGACASAGPQRTRVEAEAEGPAAPTGDHLWGISGAFIPGAPAAVDLTKAAS